MAMAMLCSRSARPPPPEPQPRGVPAPRRNRVVRERSDGSGARFSPSRVAGESAKGRNQPLTLALAISGDLLAALEPAGPDKKSSALTLTRKNRQAALRYTGLSARDATGRELRSWLELRGKRLLLRVEDGVRDIRWW